MQPTKKSIEATCPDCRGPLTLVETDGMLEIHCLVGHVYTPKSLLRAHSEAQEEALWSGVVALKEAANLVEAVNEFFQAEELNLLRAQARKKQFQSEELEQLIRQLETFKVD